MCAIASGNRQRDNTHHRLTFVLYFLSVAILSMTMVNPAQASGLLRRCLRGGVYADAGKTRPISGYSSTGSVTNPNHAYHFPSGLTGVVTFEQACVTGVLASVSSLVTAWSGNVAFDGAACNFYSSSIPAGSFTASTSIQDTYDCTTGNNSYAQFTFNAPQASGTHSFTATCVNPACTNSESGHIDVKVDGLWPIPESGGWVLIQKQGALHGNGHYLSQSALQKFFVLAGMYVYKFPNNPVLHLNDSSLEWGGLFDVAGQWTKGYHAGHKRGVVIDVRANDDTDATGAIPLASFAKFIEMAAKIKKNGINDKGIEAQIHCTSNRTDGQNRQPPTCIGKDGSQDTNRHFHILLLGVYQ